MSETEQPQTAFTICDACGWNDQHRLTKRAPVCPVCGETKTRQLPREPAPVGFELVRIPEPKDEPPADPQPERPRATPRQIAAAAAPTTPDPRPVTTSDPPVKTDAT